MKIVYTMLLTMLLLGCYSPKQDVVYTSDWTNNYTAAMLDKCKQESGLIVTTQPHLGLSDAQALYSRLVSRCVVYYKLSI